MRQVEEYLDRILAAARLAAGDARRVRGELKDHLLALIEAETAQGKSEEEAWKMVRNEFGEPAKVGEEIARAKGRVRTWLKKKSREMAISLAVTLMLAFSVKSFAVEYYKVAGVCVEPYAARGSRVLVNRLARTFQAQDLVVYRNERGLAYMGIVKSVNPDGALVLRRNDWPDQVIPKSRIIGRVFLQTR